MPIPNGTMVRIRDWKKVEGLDNDWFIPDMYDLCGRVFPITSSRKEYHYLTDKPYYEYLLGDITAFVFSEDMFDIEANHQLQSSPLLESLFE